MERKEAIEIVKSEHFQNGLLLEALKTLIPELENEDERIRKTIIRIFTEDASEQYYGFTSKQIITWLEKQERQKSVEWSEEDKLNYEQAIYVCHQNGYSAVENWLKSLKPQNKWKPTEEQLQALHAQLNEGTVTYPDDVKVLSALYEDLKKLN